MSKCCGVTGGSNASATMLCGQCSSLIHIGNNFEAFRWTQSFTGCHIGLAAPGHDREAEAQLLWLILWHSERLRKSKFSLDEVAFLNQGVSAPWCFYTIDSDEVWRCLNQ